MRYVRILFFVVVALALPVVAVVATKALWRPWMLAWLADELPAKEDQQGKASVTIELTPQAEKNFGIRTEPVVLQTYWRPLSIPGEVVELPGQSDRGITSPVAGVVTKVHRRPWEAVKPGDPLFSVKLNSDFLHVAQTNVRNAKKELDIVEAEMVRVKPPGQPLVVSDVRWRELENQQTRQKAAVEGYRHQLAALGLTTKQIDEAQRGEFLKELVVAVPEIDKEAGGLELQELKVTVGEQVTAGQLLAYVTDHQHLYLEGHAFKGELVHLEALLASRGADQRPPIEVEWLDDSARAWDASPEQLQIRFFANVIDPKSQTFPFYIPLHNQSKTYTRGDTSYRVWRYRPGQHVRLNIPVEKFEDVIVAPLHAVVREGGEAFVFRKNGALFERIPVHVVYEDHRRVAIEYDGHLAPGQALAISGAAAIHRAIKLQAGGGASEHEHGHHHHHH